MHHVFLWVFFIPRRCLNLTACMRSFVVFWITSLYSNLWIVKVVRCIVIFISALIKQLFHFSSSNNYSLQENGNSFKACVQYFWKVWRCWLKLNFLKIKCVKRKHAFFVFLEQQELHINSVIIRLSIINLSPK